MSEKIQILTSVPFDVLVNAITERLTPVIESAVRDALPDELITSQAAAGILGVSASTVSQWVRDEVLKNFGTGYQRPVLSRKEVVELKKSVVNGRLKKLKIS